MCVWVQIRVCIQREPLRRPILCVHREARHGVVHVRECGLRRTIRRFCRASGASSWRASLPLGIRQAARGGTGERLVDCVLAARWVRRPGSALCKKQCISEHGDSPCFSAQKNRRCSCSETCACDCMRTTRAHRIARCERRTRPSE